MNKGKLNILCGISNSGKTTWATQLIEEFTDSHIRVCRDEIRNRLFGYNDVTINQYYLRKDFNKKEKEVTMEEDTLILNGLEMNKTVIVDATHLQIKYLEKYKVLNVPTAITYFPISVDVAMLRNEKRARKVDINIIRKQYSMYNQLVNQLKNTPIDFT